MKTNKTAHIEELSAYYESFGIELSRLDDKPTPIGSIKNQLENLDIEAKMVKTLHMMSYNIDESIGYINKHHVNDLFNIVILGNGDTYNTPSEKPGRVKVVSSDFTFTEHVNLIELEKEVTVNTVDISGNEITETTKYFIFLEPYHAGDKNFGEYYDNKKPNQPDAEEVPEYEFLKARFYIPSQDKVKELLTEYAA